MKRLPNGDGESVLPRPGTLLGLAYLVGFNVVLWRLTSKDLGDWIAVTAALGILITSIGIIAVPERWLFQSPFRQPYSPRISGLFRLTFYTAAFAILAHFRWVTHGRSAIYPLLLWFVPLTTTYMFYMFLRDIYQHTNADAGRLTNSRVFFVDAFTRWAVFVHGQDMHVPHHLFPAVPHYNLPELHELLKQTQADYAVQVVECHGTFANRGGAPTILDVLTADRPEPAE